MPVYVDPYGSYLRGYTAGQELEQRRQEYISKQAKTWLDLQAKYDFQLDPMDLQPAIPSSDPFLQKQQRKLAGAIRVKLLGFKKAAGGTSGSKSGSGAVNYADVGRKALAAQGAGAGAQGGVLPAAPAPLTGPAPTDYPLGEPVPPEIPVDAVPPTNPADVLFDPVLYLQEPGVPAQPDPLAGGPFASEVAAVPSPTGALDAVTPPRHAGYPGVRRATYARQSGVTPDMTQPYFAEPTSTQAAKLGSSELAPSSPGGPAQIDVLHLWSDPFGYASGVRRSAEPVPLATPPTPVPPEAPQPHEGKPSRPGDYWEPPARPAGASLLERRRMRNRFSRQPYSVFYGG